MSDPAAGSAAPGVSADAGEAGTPALSPLRFAHALDPARSNTRDTVASFATSALFHSLLIGLLLWLGHAGVLKAAGDIGVGTGIGAGLAGGGGGGSPGNEQFAYLELPEPPPPAEAAEPAVVVPAIETPTIPSEPVPDLTAETAAAAAEAAAAALAVNAGSGTGAGTGTGPGVGPGSGPGSGGGSGGGEGGGIGSGVGPGIGRGRLLAPSPSLILVPPTAPKGVKGRTIVVRLDVDSTGMVRGVELRPPTGDRGYDEKLRKAALGWKFQPARDASNRPVAALFDVEFTF